MQLVARLVLAPAVFVEKRRHRLAPASRIALRRCCFRGKRRGSLHGAA
jgi:hypothetical protein